MSIADKATVQLRFPVGTRVECNCGTWKAGTIVAHFYTQPDFGRGKCVPYQVRLDEGDRLIFAPNDEDVVVRRLKKKKKGRGGGAGTAAEGAPAPVLPSGKNEPSRFQVGDRVEVQISRNSDPGSPQGVEIISFHNIAGGRWVPARVHELRYAQDDWCRGIYCAYAVQVHGDVTPDGVQYATPVREDDERCIRAAPVAPRPAPPRFAVGTRVECYGGPGRGWKAGVVREIWPEAPSGALLPYSVELDAGGSCLIPIDEDLGIRAMRVVGWGGHEAWGDSKGVEAVYDLLVGGSLRDKKALPKVGLCGDAHAVDALSDAVAACPTEARRVKLMLEQILATAEEATPRHPLVGARVRVHGLSGSAELNGQCGTAVSFAPERERYEVRLDGGGGKKTVAVRDANLSPEEEPFVTCPICMDARLTDPLGPAPQGPGGGTATVTLCCGKVVCNKCHETYVLKGIDRVAQTFPNCPFCREPTGYMDEHADQRLERELLKRRATQGDALAMYNLSGSFDAGAHGLPVDHQASLAWAALAAMVGGHVRAMNNVGFALKLGEGTRADPRRAAPWFARGAVLDHVSCVWALGKAYADGHGVARDLAAAQRWLKRGKEMGDPQSAFDLSRLPAPHGEAMGGGSGAGFAFPSGMPPELTQMMAGMR